MFEEALVPSASLGRNRAVWVDAPEGKAADGLCVVLDAENYLCNVGLGSILDQVRGDGWVGRQVFVHVPFVTPENRHAEYTCDPAFEQFLTQDLLPWTHEKFPKLNQDRRALIGLSLSGLQAIWTALRNPGAFAAVVSQSPSAWYRDECLLRQIDPAAEAKTAFRISVGSEETTTDAIHQPGDLHQKASQVESCGRLVEALQSAGHKVTYSIFEGEHDSECWAAEMPDALRWLAERQTVG